MEDYPRSVAEFESRFATEEACREHLFRLRWPDGFRCPRCRGTKIWKLDATWLQCVDCDHQTSVTVGTVLQDTRKPLTTWFSAMWYVTSQKNVREDDVSPSNPGPMTEFTVAVYKNPTEHKIRLAQVLKWAEPTTKEGPAGITKRNRVRAPCPQQPERRGVLLTTFSDAMSNALGTKLRRLIGNEPRLGERVEVHSMNAIGQRLYELNVGHPQIASRETIQTLLEEAAGTVERNKFSLHFLMTEWEQIVDAWRLETWDAYRDVARLGRRTRLKENQRIGLWSIFERVRSGLNTRGLITYSDLFSRLASKLAESAHTPFDFVVVDEAQDVSVAQLRFLAALGSGRAKRPFLCRRPGSADFSAALLMESARRRCSRAVFYTANQLPDLTPDQNAGRSPAGPRVIRRRWQYGGRQRHNFDVQRATAQHHGLG